MPIIITNNESNISRRVIPISAISASNGTSPATVEAGGQPQWMIGGLYKGNTTNTLSAASANRGEYYVTLTQSEVSVVGQGAVYYSSTTALEWSTPFQVVAYDSGDSVGLGLSGVTVGAIKAGTYSGVTVGSAATILAGTYSGVTLGVNNIAAGNYSGVTISGVTTSNNLDKTGYGVTTIAAGTYSGVTVGSAATILAGTYSGVTLGINNILAGTYSGVTLGINNIAAGTYSGVTVGINNIAPNTYSGVTTSGFDSGGNQAVANSLLSTNLGSSRLVQEALFVLRNKVDIAGSVMTVYRPDDVTSAFTASVTTGTVTLNTIDPT